MTSRLRAADLLPLVAAAAIPLIFLHLRYQAHASFGPVDVYGSDVAIALTVAAAVVAGVMFGWEPLARGRALWIVASALLALFVIACFWRPLERTTTNLVTAAKMIEYALLAPAVVLLFRRAVDLERFLAVFVVWAAAAGGWGLLQFFGVVNEFDGRRTGQREVSFLGHQDLGVFTGAALTLGLVAIVLGERRRLLIWAGVVGGSLGVALDASIFAFLGVVLAAAAAALVGRRLGTLTLRRLVALGAILLVVGSGVYVLRGSDVSNYLSFLGLSKAAQTDNGVQSGSQRTMLAWIGWRMWVDHPLLGIGFERSNTDFQPYLAAAKRKFPGQPAEAFPSNQNRWGVQNLWVELLADTGIVGLVLGVATFVTGLAIALRAVPRRAFVALAATCWILVALGTWNALGIVAGIPVDAVTWLGFGLGVVAWEIA